MKLKDYLLVTFFTLISFGLHGYYFNVFDHHHYLPYLNKILNPSLYPYDYYFTQPHYLYTPFNYALVYINKFFNLNLAWTHFIVYFISLWLLYLAIYFLTLTIYRRQSIASFAIALFILPKWATKIGYLTHHFYFVSRDLSLALSLLALSYLLLKKPKTSFIYLFLATLVNPLIPIPVAILFITQFINTLNLKNKSFALIPINPQWLAILRNRAYSFPQLWAWTAWGNLTLFFSLLGISWLTLKAKLFGKHYELIKQFILICLSLFIFHFLISLALPLPFLIQLQLLRSLNYIFYFCLISFAAANYYLLFSSSTLIKITSLISLTGVYLWSMHLTGWHFLAIWLLPLVILIKQPKINFKTKFNLIPFIILSLILHLSYNLIIIKPQINLPQYFHYPNPLIALPSSTDWLDIQTWAKNNTSVDTIFLTHPKLPGFRNFSERSIVCSDKDGGLVFYSETYAIRWQQCMTDLKNYSNFNTQEFQNLSQKYKFNYIVVNNSHQSLNFDLAYQNLKYLVYKI